MAYNFPATYQPMYYPQQTYQQNYQQTQQPSSSIIWVQGEAGARGYLVAPNTTVQLWDSERQTIYLKSADASGMPSLKVLDYTVRDTLPVKASNPTPATQNTETQYATKEETKALYGQISALKTQMDELTKKVSGDE